MNILGKKKTLDIYLKKYKEDIEVKKLKNRKPIAPTIFVGKGTIP